MEVPLVARAAEIEPRAESCGAKGASQSPQVELACSALHTSVAARPTERLVAGRRSGASQSPQDALSCSALHAS
eukprot:7925709-Alexandrium_andersonii.AAC.1